MFEVYCFYLLIFKLWTHRDDFNQIRFPQFPDNRHTKVGSLSAPTAFTSHDISQVFNSVRGWVHPRDTVRPEGCSQWNISMTPSEIEPATFSLVAQRLDQLRHRVPIKKKNWTKSCNVLVRASGCRHLRTRYSCQVHPSGCLNVSDSDTLQYSAVQYNAVHYSTGLLIQTSFRMGFVVDTAPVEQVVPRILRLSRVSVIPSILPSRSPTTNATQIQQLTASLHNTPNKWNIVHRRS